MTYPKLIDKLLLVEDNKVIFTGYTHTRRMDGRACYFGNWYVEYCGEGEVDLGEMFKHKRVRVTIEVTDDLDLPEARQPVTNWSAQAPVLTPAEEFWKKNPRPTLQQRIDFLEQHCGDDEGTAAAIDDLKRLQAKERKTKEPK